MHGTVKNNLEMREVEDDEEEKAQLVSLRTLFRLEEEASSGPSSSEGTVEEASWTRTLRRLELDQVRREDPASGPKQARQTIPSIRWGMLVKKHITPSKLVTHEVSDPRPLVVVLTAYKLKIIIFPFHDGSQRLVNAVELQEFKLWKGERRMLDIGVLNLLLSLMHDESLLRKYSIEADKAQIPQEARIPKKLVSTILR